MTTISLPLQNINRHDQIMTNPLRKLIQSGIKPQKPINTVGKIMESMVSAQGRQALLGVNDNGKPVFLDFNAASYGSVLIMSEPGFGKTHQLQVIIESVLSRQYRYKVRPIILTNAPWEWQTQIERYQRAGMRVECHHWQSEETPKLIRKLVEIVQLRQVDKRSTRDVLLVMDEIDTVKFLDEETQIYVDYLISCGAVAKFRTVATITARADLDLMGYMQSFITHIYGHLTIEESALENELPGFTPISLDPGEFALKIDGQWMAYRLPMIGN